MTRASHLTSLLAAAALTACLGYDATPPPAAEVVFSLDVPAGTAVVLTAHDEYEKKIVERTVEAQGQPLTLVLPTSRDYVALRLSAKVGQRLLKVVVPALARDQRADLGQPSSGSEFV